MLETDPYLLVAKLGEGGMAEVFKAVKKGPDGWEKPIALKRILPYLADNESFIQMLSAEARLHAQLDHPNIVQLLDFFREGETYFIAMEYVPGKNLRQIIVDARRREISFPWQVAIQIIAQTLRGLDHAHKRRGSAGPLNIVHRDISPQNILISYEGFVKLSDFGIAMADIQREATESGVLKGKHRYLAPEQLESKSVDQRTDLYSAGVLLYELVCGEHPFASKSDFETMKKIVASDFKSPEILRPDAPLELHRVIKRAMKSKASARYKDASTFIRSLLEVQDTNWHTHGNEELAMWMGKIYPKPIDREEQSPEKTRILPGQFPYATEVTGTHSLISGIAEISLNGGARRILIEKSHAGWAFAGALTLLGGFAAWQWVGPSSNVAKRAPIVTRVAPQGEYSTVNDSMMLPMDVPQTPPIRRTQSTKVKVTKPIPKAVAKVTPRRGRLNVDGPVGSAIYINGKKIGKIPMKSYRLAPGNYLVLVAPPKKPGAASRVTIRPRRTSYVRWSNAADSTN